MTGDHDPHDPRPLDGAELEHLFAAARRSPPAPVPDAFAARLIAAAEAAVPPRPASRGPGLLAQLRAALAAFGGVTGLASVSAAGVAGLWLGLAGPVGGSGVPGLIWLSAAEVSPSVALFLDETTPFDDFDLQN